jgi:hypothetical protein
LEAQPFWPRATATVHAERPGFVFMAEVYWDLEWTLQQQGFDYTYDKRLYDRLREGDARPVREHLSAGLDFQDHLARFLENHDEPRAAATFPPAEHRAAAVVTFFAPGLRFFHMGQREGRTVRIPMHIRRGPVEAADPELSAFYDQLLASLDEAVYRDGDWQLVDSRPAWAGNGTNDDFICYAWSGTGDERRLICVNYSAHASQCYVGLPWRDLAGRSWRFADSMGNASYDRDGESLARDGLYLDVGPWDHRVFEVDALG